MCFLRKGPGTRTQRQVSESFVNFIYSKSNKYKAPNSAVYKKMEEHQRRSLRLNRPAKTRSAEERLPKRRMVPRAARSENELDSASFIPSGREFKDLLSRISAIRFKDLAKSPEDKTAMLLGTMDIGYTDNLEAHQVVVNGKAKVINVQLQSGKLSDVVTSINAVVTSTPADILDVSRRLPEGRAFFTYTLTSCGGSRLCFTAARRLFSFEAASKHSHLMFLRRESNVFAAGEMGVFGRQFEDPTLIVMNRVSGTIMLPLAKRNPGINFDRVVKLAASQFWGTEWDVRSIIPGFSGPSDSGSDSESDSPHVSELELSTLADLIRSAQRGTLTRKMIIVGEHLPVFEQADGLGPLPDATLKMSVEELAQRFPDSTLASEDYVTETRGNFLNLKKIRDATQALSGLTYRLKEDLAKLHAMLLKELTVPDNKQRIAAYEKRVRELEEKIEKNRNPVTKLDFKNYGDHQSLGFYIAKEKAALSNLLEFPVTHYPFTLSDFAARTRVKEAVRRAERAEQQAKEADGSAIKQTLAALAKAARQTAAAETLAAEAVLEERRAVEDARLVAKDAIHAAVVARRIKEKQHAAGEVEVDEAEVHAQEEVFVASEKRVAVLEAEKRRTAEAREVLRRVARRRAEEEEERRAAAFRVTGAAVIARRIAEDMRKVPSKRRKTASA